jgi:hypothetical protein
MYAEPAVLADAAATSRWEGMGSPLWAAMVVSNNQTTEIEANNTLRIRRLKRKEEARGIISGDSDG